MRLVGSAPRVCTGQEYKYIGLNGQGPGQIARVLAWDRILSLEEIHQFTNLVDDGFGLAQPSLAPTAPSLAPTEPKLPAGEQCTASGECASPGICLQGRCCASDNAARNCKICNENGWCGACRMASNGKLAWAASPLSSPSQVGG